MRSTLSVCSAPFSCAIKSEPLSTMPFKKYDHIEDVPPPPRDPEPGRALRAGLSFNAIFDEPLFRGLHRYRTLEQARRAREEAEEARAGRMRRARLNTLAPKHDP